MIDLPPLGVWHLRPHHVFAHSNTLQTSDIDWATSNRVRIRADPSQCITVPNAARLLAEIGRGTPHGFAPVTVGKTELASSDE